MIEKDVTIEMLVGKVFASQIASKLHHFTTSSDSQHRALKYFYSASDEAMDNLVECWQGHFNTVLADVDIVHPDIKDITAHLREEADWIEAYRDEIAGESAHIANLVDALVSVYTKTIDMMRRS